MWLHQCTRYCRIIVLAFIVALCVYIMYYNSKHIKEKFIAEAQPPALPADAESREIIEKSFKKWLNRVPEPFEIQMYLPIVQKSKDNIELERRLKETAEYMYIQERNRIDVTAQGFDPVQAEELEDVDFNARMEAYNIVIGAFESTLERLPNNKELNYYTYRFIKESGFKKEQIEKALKATEEYSILSKMQDNHVYGELPGNITEAQIKLELYEVYEAVTGKPDMPHSLEVFLLGKYKAYHLDKTKLKKLILTIEHIDDDSEIRVMRKVSQASVNVTEEATGAASDSALQPPLDGRDAFASANASYELVQPSLQELQTRIAEEREKGKGQGEMGALYKDDVIQLMKKKVDASGNSLCSQKPVQKKDERDRVAEYVLSRNMDALRFTCMRDSYYDYMDESYEDMYPDYKALAEQRAKMQEPVDEVLPVLASTQLSGTILDSAKKTGVGSILPKFVYKEY